MRTGFAKIRNGLEEHLIAGCVGFFEAGIYLTIHLQADFRRGVWIGSAPRLLATAPRGASLRSVQRALERLTEIGFLRVFHTHGARGNYVCLIDKYEPQSGAQRGRRLNAAASVDWKHPTYEAVAERDTESGAERVAEDAPIQDKELGQDLKPKHTRAPSAPGARAIADLSGFEKAWTAYPKKVARKAAERAWARVAADEHTKILSDVEARRSSDQWVRDSGRYIPHFATYLNGQRRKDQAKPEVNDGATYPRGGGDSRSNGKTPAAAHSNAVGLSYRKPSEFQRGNDPSPN